MYLFLYIHTVFCPTKSTLLNSMQFNTTVLPAHGVSQELVTFELN